MQKSKRLNDHAGCSYKHNKKSLISYPALQTGGELEVWDIEGLLMGPPTVFLSSDLLAYPMNRSNHYRRKDQW